MKQIARDSHHVEHPFQGEMLEKLWEPISIGRLELKNRIAMAPIQRLPAEPTWPDMHPTHIAFHEAIARGGAGMIVIGEAIVTKEAGGVLQSASGERRQPKGIWSDEAIPGWTRLIEACHKWEAKVVPQLSTHAAWVPRIAGIRGEGSMELIVQSGEETGMTPAVLEREKENYVKAALRAQQAGADGVQIHGIREGLVSLLLSEIRNPRVPGYSKDIKERVRFPAECIREIKKACGKDYPVMMRLSGTEYIAGGFDIEYTKEVARELADAGVDCIDIVQAGFSTQVPQQQMTVPPGAFAHYARSVKSYLNSLGEPYNGVIVMNSCRVQNPWLAASLLRNGDCDMVSICRQLIADPDWPNKIRKGRIDDIIPCNGCSWCMRSFTCAVNPESPFYKSKTQRENVEMTQAGRVKTALVAGGGLAGMEAARALAMRGHRVTLYEKEASLGRKLYIQSLAPFRTDMDLLRKYLTTQMKKLKVKVRCRREVTAELVEKEKPEVVIVATGCRPALPEIAGIESHPNVVSAEDVLLEKADLGIKVVVIDADLDHDYCSLGSFAAQFAARTACLRDDVAMHISRWSPQHSPEDVSFMSNHPVGREVTLVTRNDRIADVEYHHYTTTEELRRLGVRVITGCNYREVDEKGISIVKDGRVEMLEADTIITANYDSDDRLYGELEGKVEELYLVGDARDVQIQYIANVHGPYRLALTV